MCEGIVTILVTLLTQWLLGNPLKIACQTFTSLLHSLKFVWFPVRCADAGSVYVIQTEDAIDETKSKLKIFLTLCVRLGGLCAYMSVMQQPVDFSFFLFSFL